MNSAFGPLYVTKKSTFVRLNVPPSTENVTLMDLSVLVPSSPRASLAALNTVPSPTETDPEGADALVAQPQLTMALWVSIEEFLNTTLTGVESWSATLNTWLVIFAPV